MAIRRDIRLFSYPRGARTFSLRGTPLQTPRFPSAILIGCLALMQTPVRPPTHGSGFSIWAEQDKLTLIGYHFAFPGIGNVAKDGDAYHFVPAAMDT